MANPNLLDLAERKKIIEAITHPENVARKNFEQRKFDIYRKRQANYVLERLADEFNPETVKRMRKVLSINPCKRIIDQLGSIYAQEPERHFSNTASTNTQTEKVDAGSEDAGADQELEQQLAEFYHCNGVDPQMRLANRYYKLCDQAALYVVPRGGKITPRALTPKDYDVVPDADDPEKAFAYILSVFDTNLYGVQARPTKEVSNKYNYSGKVNTPIADDSDRNRLLERYVFWTDDLHFTTDGHGEFVGDGPQPNPIERLPFIDIALEKDFQFFVRRGSDVSEFVIDLLVQLSDLAEISRMQGYSQAVIYSPDEPRSLVIGPQRVLWIKQPTDSQQSQPKFAFESPAPDLANGLEIINTQLKMFLSSNGLDASTVTGDTPAQAFTSGVDHLLANVDKFKASQEDIDLFRKVETELFDLLRLWSNLYQSVTGPDELEADLKIGVLSPDIEMEICYPEPAVVETKKEKEDSTIKRWDKGLLTTKDALKELYGYDDKKADEYIKELDKDKQMNMRPAKPGQAVDANGKPIQPDPNNLANGSKPDPKEKPQPPPGNE